MIGSQLAGCLSKFQKSHVTGDESTLKNLAFKGVLSVTKSLTEGYFEARRKKGWDKAS